jgi:hypothetical protein
MMMKLKTTIFLEFESLSTPGTNGRNGYPCRASFRIKVRVSLLSGTRYCFSLATKRTAYCNLAKVQYVKRKRRYGVLNLGDDCSRTYGFKLIRLHGLHFSFQLIQPLPTSLVEHVNTLNRKPSVLTSSKSCIDLETFIGYMYVVCYSRKCIYVYFYPHSF